MYKIKGYPQFVKDPKSGAILLNDKRVRDEAEAKTRAAHKINTMESDISTLKNDMSEIKQMLQTLIGTK